MGSLFSRTCPRMKQQSFRFRLQADVRQAQQQGLTWSMQADLEAIAWSPASPTTFVAAAEDGIVAAFDARAGSQSAPLFRLSAHDQPTSAVSFCRAAAGLLCTASTDGVVRLGVQVSVMQAGLRVQLCSSSLLFMVCRAG